VKLEQTFEVAAPLERVWAALIDVEQVAPHLPGASITGRNDDGSYEGAFTVKIGPTTVSYAGRLQMDSVDEASHTATILASGTDRRGQGGAKATIVSRVSESGEGTTRVEVDTDYHITGRLARFGRGGMIEDISERLLREFAARLQASLVREEPVDGSGGADASEAAAAADEPASPWVPRAAPAPAAEPAPATAPAPASAPAPTPGPEPAAAPDPTRPPASPPAPPDAPALEAHSLLAGVLAQRIRRNPAPWITGAVLMLLWRRRGRRRRARRAADLI
jgi:carbon monoxide dehydrogenase subunit G